jgi:pyruvate dehydrogenase E2 component (dihydrolipoamide acetyltransferase)
MRLGESSSLDDDEEEEGSKLLGMISNLKLKDILMPRFDPEMKSGRVVEWLKKEGERVKKGEPVVRIDTEKVSLDVESPESGTLVKILVNPPEEVPVGTPLGSIRLEGETEQVASETKPEFAAAQLGVSEAQIPSQESSKIGMPAIAGESERSIEFRASPSARRTARELGIDLSLVKGTGPGGRITSEDVERYYEQSRQTSQAQAQQQRAAEVAQPIPSAEQALRPSPVKVKKLDAMRTSIAQKMVESWTKIPQVPLFVEVDLGETEKFRAAMEKMIGRSVSLTAIVTKALASALRHFPDLNSRLEGEEELHIFEDVDVSIAVALEGGGLVAPVIRSANRKTPTQITQEIEELAAKARSGKLSLSEVRGGTTTVSNLSSFGVDYFIPIINPPQATILGVGKVRRGEEAAGGLRRGSPVCTITLAFDHRVTDGAEAAKLLEKIKEYIESPYLLQMA